MSAFRSQRQMIATALAIAESAADALATDLQDRDMALAHYHRGLLWASIWVLDIDGLKPRYELIRHALTRGEREGALDHLQLLRCGLGHCERQFKEEGKGVPK